MVLHMSNVYSVEYFYSSSVYYTKYFMYIIYYIIAE